MDASKNNLNNKLLPKYKNFHFIGILGSGMCPLAAILKHFGKNVKGSDLTRNSINETILRSMDIVVEFQQTSDQIKDVDVVVISSAVPQHNPEVRAALACNIPILHRSDILKCLVECFKSICVAGTHGKTTTTAMAAYFLSEINIPTIAAIGGIGLNNESNIYLSNLIEKQIQNSYFVAESDESDGSFLKYYPYISIVNNIENDHLDYYESQQMMVDNFVKFINQTNEEGGVILGWDCPQIRSLSQSIKHPNKLGFGFNIGCDVRAFNRRILENSGGGFVQEFTAIVERDQVNVKLQVAGRHNVLNALACLSLARCLDLDLADTAKALGKFVGVRRRLERRFVLSDGSIVYDDYAHNPGKITACLASLKESYPHHRIAVLFQPHRYTRLRTMYNEFIGCFGEANIVYLLPVYSAGEQDLHHYNEQKFAQDIADESNTHCEIWRDLNVFPKSFFNTQQPSIFLCLGAGDVWKIAQLIADWDKEKRPPNKN